ncbi:MAG: 2'-5' RNA ligase family protein [Acidimicrobiales bacterium]
MSSPVVPEKRLSVWGVLARADENRITRFIDVVAKRYGTPTFRPHVTLVSDVKREETEARDVLRAVASVTPRIVVGLHSVTHSSRMFRAVVLECGHGDEALKDMRDVLSRDLAVRSPNPFLPHVSVAYGSFNEAQRRAMALEAEEQLLSPITIASLDLVDTGGDDVSAWSSPWPDFALQ